MTVVNVVIFVEFTIERCKSILIIYSRDRQFKSNCVRVFVI